MIKQPETKAAGGPIETLTDETMMVTPRRHHPYGSFALRLGLGAAVIAFLLWHYKARPILQALERERPLYFVAAILLYVAGQVLSAYRWQLLAALVAVHGPFVDFLSFYFVGMFTNLFVPGLIGGDAARAVYLGKRRNCIGKAVASVIADRGVGLLALCWFAAATVLVLKGGFLPASVVRPTLAVGFAALLGFLFAPLLARLIPRMPQRLGATAELVGPYLRHPASLLPAIMLSLVLQGGQAVCQYILAIGLGLEFPLAAFMLCVPIANVLAALPVTLNGLGVREAAYLVLFGFAGMSKVDAIALGLLWFASTMVGGLTGAIAFVMTDMPRLREAPASADTVGSSGAG
jgi:glycosyltransferase 2 family protein